MTQTNTDKTVDTIALEIAEAVMGNPSVIAVLGHGTPEAEAFKSDIQIEVARVLRANELATWKAIDRIRAILANPAPSVQHDLEAIDHAIKSRTQEPAEWQVEAAWARAEKMSPDTYIQNKSALREILKAVEAARSKLAPHEYPEGLERYDFVGEVDCGLEPSPTGEWVLYSQAQAALTTAIGRLTWAANTHPDPKKGALLREWADELRAATPPAPERKEVGTPYAHEFGKSNGDGTYCVVIEKCDRAYAEQFAVKDWPIKPLYASPVPLPVTDEMVLVPREPTEAMLDAYWHQTGESREMRERTHAYMRRYWRAMLEALSKPGEQG